MSDMDAINGNGFNSWVDYNASPSAGNIGDEAQSVATDAPTIFDADDLALCAAITEYLNSSPSEQDNTMNTEAGPTIALESAAQVPELLEQQARGEISSAALLAMCTSQETAPHWSVQTGVDSNSIFAHLAGGNISSDSDEDEEANEALRKERRRKRKYDSSA